MRFTIEEDQQISLLILGKTHNLFLEKLKEKLSKNAVHVVTSTRNPIRLDQFQYIFVSDERELPTSKKVHCVLFLFHNKRRFTELIANNHLYEKIINVDPDETHEHTLENIVWFIFSKTAEKGLNVERLIEKQKQKKRFFPAFKHKITRKMALVSAIIVCIFIEFFFLLPMCVGGFFLYKSSQALKKYDITATENYLYISRPFITVATNSYQISRPVLSLLYLAILPDNIIALENTGSAFIETTLQTSQNGKETMALLLKKNKNPDEIADTTKRITYLKSQLSTLSQELNSIEAKLDIPLPQAQKMKNSLEKNGKSLKQLNSLISKSDSLLGKDHEKNYLILFENNMELRPGGGFIGSYGIITVSNYTIEHIKIQDVYDADGQLKGHVDPPDAIRVYLNQPNWFFRDSNFSPDFPENYNKAIYFLDQELKHPPFDGGIAITTTAIDNLLAAIGEIYVPDYNETINKDNFYIKTQTHVENNFFPGSIQKKSFLSSLVDQIFIKIETSSPKDLYLALKKNLDEKQTVVYLTDNDLQKYIDQAGWSGKLLIPQCAITVPQCVLDSLFPVDANLGVNKANFFIERLQSMKVTINDNGSIKNVASLLFKNNSSYEVFPGGTYKNFLQIYLPPGITVNQITKDGTKISDFNTETTDLFTIVSLYTEISPKTSQTIEIAYDLKDTIQKGRGAYELVIQKQVGTPNTDIHFEISFPENISLVHQNFEALAKGRSLNYNTSLSTDKIFLIEFIKK